MPDISWALIFFQLLSEKKSRYVAQLDCQGYQLSIPTALKNNGISTNDSSGDRLFSSIEGPIGDIVCRKKFFQKNFRNHLVESFRLIPHSAKTKNLRQNTPRLFWKLPLKSLIYMWYHVGNIFWHSSHAPWGSRRAVIS